MKLGRNPNPKVMPPKRRLTNPPIYKITIVGSEGVGKTTFTKVYQSTYFEIKYIPTIDYSKTDVLFESPTTQCIFSIYDIGGQKDIPEINHIHYTDTNAIILMFDVTDQISYDNLSFWYNDIMKVCSKDTPVVLVGNKYDIDNYKIDRNSIISQYESKGIKYFEVSSRRNENIKDVFEYIYEKLTGESCKEALQRPQLKADLRI
jgi:small GTP-binding protein